ncbi:carboxypeptidase-like regulatory domain-containing protein [Croceitalea sp. MTPC6]
MFSFAPVAYSQSDEFITGKLLDAKTKEPIVFATVRIQGKALGVISNLDGGFKIPIEFQLEGTVLEISSMGYETKNIQISTLKKNGINTILIKSAVLELQETIVTAKAKRSKRLSARKIIKYALERIPDNYPNDPFSLIGYYRDYQLQKKEYINLNEAIVQVFDMGFQSDDYTNTQYGLFSYEKNKDFKVDSLAAKPYDYVTKDKFIPDASLISDYGGNELMILHIHDAIRNHDIKTYSFVNKLTEDFLKGHLFSSVEKTSYGNKAVYKIGIKKMMPPFQVVGTIYIDKSNYAIRKLDYAVYKKNSDSSFENKRDFYNSTEKELLIEILVEYTDIKDKMYLNYISFHNKFRIRRPALFRIKKGLFDKANGLLEIELNKPAKNYDELKLSDFSLTFKGKEIRVQRIIKAVGNKITVKLSSKPGQIELISQLLSNDRDLEKEKLFMRIKNLIDEDFNLLDERKLESFDQFREFFTQKVIKDFNNDFSKEDLMYKTIPLYDSSQPIYKKNDNVDYWMNTPLKTIEN